MTARKRHKVKITVKAVTRGKCPLGMEPGDSWTYHRHVPEGICLTAFCTLAPAIRTLSSLGDLCSYLDGGVAEGEEVESDQVELSCPDPGHGVIYEVRRVRE
ncbi:MAG: TIGR04076 family protein [Chloroflexi bacterium]|nr:TIGR04076 family protein [Chloroflexota bacterium]